MAASLCASFTEASRGCCELQQRVLRQPCLGLLPGRTCYVKVLFIVSERAADQGRGRGNGVGGGLTNLGKLKVKTGKPIGWGKWARQILSMVGPLGRM